MTHETCAAQVLDDKGVRVPCGQIAFGTLLGTAHCFFHLLEVCRTRQRPLPIVPAGRK